jgi:hypothetical protein
LAAALPAAAFVPSPRLLSPRIVIALGAFARFALRLRRLHGRLPRHLLHGGLRRLRHWPNGGRRDSALLLPLLPGLLALHLLRCAVLAQRFFTLHLLHPTLLQMQLLLLLDLLLLDLWRRHLLALTHFLCRGSRPCSFGAWLMLRLRWRL